MRTLTLAILLLLVPATAQSATLYGLTDSDSFGVDTAAGGVTRDGTLLLIGNSAGLDLDDAGNLYAFVISQTQSLTCGFVQCRYLLDPTDASTILLGGNDLGHFPGFKIVIDQALASLDGPTSSELTSASDQVPYGVRLQRRVPTRRQLDRPRRSRLRSRASLRHRALARRSRPEASLPKVSRGPPNSYTAQSLQPGAPLAYTPFPWADYLLATIAGLGALALVVAWCVVPRQSLLLLALLCAIGAFIAAGW